MPTQVGSDTRFVCWNAITSARTIGNQAKTPKITRSGTRNTKAARPSLLTRRRTDRRRVTSGFAADTGTCVDGAPERSSAPSTLTRSARGVCVQECLDLGIGCVEERVDVGVLVGQD